MRFPFNFANWRQYNPVSEQAMLSHLLHIYVSYAVNHFNLKNFYRVHCIELRTALRIFLVSITATPNNSSTFFGVILDNFQYSLTNVLPKWISSTVFHLFLTSEAAAESEILRTDGQKLIVYFRFKNVNHFSFSSPRQSCTTVSYYRERESHANTKSLAQVLPSSL